MGGVEDFRLKCQVDADLLFAGGDSRKEVAENGDIHQKRHTDLLFDLLSLIPARYDGLPAEDELDVAGGYTCFHQLASGVVAFDHARGLHLVPCRTTCRVQPCTASATRPCDG